MEPTGQREGDAAPQLPALSIEQVVRNLDEGLARGGALAMDADGTLWSGDVGIDTFTSLLERREVLPSALSALRAEAHRYGLAIESDPNEQALRLYEAFERGSYPEDRAFEMMAWVPAGHTHDQMRAFAHAVIEEKRLASRLHGELSTVLDWALRRGVPVYVVSASPDWIVVPAIDRLALPVARVFAMKPASDGGALVTRIEGPPTYGAGKLLALHGATGGARLLGAFGDSAFDLPMLREADVAVAVRPKPELRARSRECPGLVELVPA
jgi:phosphoserine phosphatase